MVDGGYTAQFVRFENIPRSLLGTFFDQKFGLFVYAPVYILVLGGVWPLVTRRGWTVAAAVCAMTAGAFAAGSLRLYMWWEIGRAHV